MNLTKIRLLGQSVIELPILGAKPSDIFQFKGAEGLGPPESAVTIVKGQYQGRQTQDRQIVMRIGLNVNYRAGQTASTLRETIYQLLAGEDADPVQFQLLGPSDAMMAQVDCYVSKIESGYSGDEPEVQVTFDCAGPYFISPVERNVTPTAKNNFIINNSGSAPTGFRFAIEFVSAYSTGWTLTRGTQKMSFDTAFQAGDALIINTIPGERELVRIRNGVDSTILHTLTKTSKWIMLRPGDNNFTTSGSNFVWAAVPIRYTPRYWGV